MWHYTQSQGLAGSCTCNKKKRSHAVRVAHCTCVQQAVHQESYYASDAAQGNYETVPNTKETACTGNTCLPVNTYRLLKLPFATMVRSVQPAVPWRDLPYSQGSWHSCHDRHTGQHCRPCQCLVLSLCMVHRMQNLLRWDPLPTCRRH